MNTAVSTIALLEKGRFAKWLTCLLGLVLTGLFFPVVQAQDTPTDFLPASFHAERRQALRTQMPPKSVAVFFANPVRNRSNDVDYVYHQDPDFYYLTGYREPNGVLLIFSEEQTTNGLAYNEALFVQPKDERAELWNGKRLGVEGAKTALGFSQVFSTEEFETFGLDTKKFDRILFLDFNEDVRDSKSDTADLYSLIAQFKQKVAYPADYSSDRFRIYEYIKSTEGASSANVAQVIGKRLARSPILSDKLLTDYLKADSDKNRKKAINSFPDSKLDGYTLNYVLNSLRETKLPAELKLLRKAVAISAIGQVEVMKAMHPGMSETEVQGIHEYVFKKYGAEFEGYPSIVGAGHNGCVLHYIENNKQKVGNDLVLMDLGAEYRGYTADVTRTIPANGKFTPEQRAIYEIVLEAQNAAMAACKPGTPFFEPNQASSLVIGKRLKELGIIENEAEYSTYLPHGISHHIGLDVHDRGNYGPLQENQVITIEPGIYIPENSKCDPKWWGIAVRIEDDILITATGFELLSVLAPRNPDDIEKLMAEPSPLDDFVLPSLDK